MNRSTAFRTVWELGELEYVLQRVTLWVTRKTNRYTVEQAAAILGWKPDALETMLRERGVDAGEAPPPAAPSPASLDTRFLD